MYCGVGVLIKFYREGSARSLNSFSNWQDSFPVVCYSNWLGFWQCAVAQRGKDDSWRFSPITVGGRRGSQRLGIFSKQFTQRPQLVLSNWGHNNRPGSEAENGGAHSFILSPILQRKCQVLTIYLPTTWTRYCRRYSSSWSQPLCTLLDRSDLLHPRIQICKILTFKTVGLCPGVPSVESVHPGKAVGQQSWQKKTH